MLAERTRLPVVLLAAVTAVLAIAVLRPSHKCTRSHATHIENVTLAAPTSIDPSCPPHIRGVLKLEGQAWIYCARGEFPQPGTLVRAFYRTTELWERIAVVSDDGTLVMPMSDQPSLLRAPEPIFAEDVDQFLRR